MSILNIIKLTRPEQWLKNMFIFLPLFFDRKLMDMQCLVPALLAFASYCMAASSIYCFNDIFDAEADKMHPTKCKRPVASGEVSKRQGYAIMAVTIAAALAIAFLLNPVARYRLIAIIGTYYIMNIAYCVKLKNIALVDIFTIAMGFVLRILCGGLVPGIWVSQWLVLMTFLLALFLAFAKRRDDVVMYEGTGIAMRKNVNRYNLAFMNQAIGLIASVTMVSYIMYSVSEEVTRRMGSDYLYLTSFFVLMGILRYMQLTIVDVKSGSPTRVLLHDRFIQVCLLCWIAVFFFIIYC